jgi:phosphoribosylamine--glycine ligase
MKILVIGGGGREHALVWKLKQSDKVDSIFCAPGNAGIQQLATCISLAVNDISGLLDFALNEKIDLTIVGPEEPLTIGIVDAFQSKGLRIFGPDSKGAYSKAARFSQKIF